MGRLVVLYGPNIRESSRRSAFQRQLICVERRAKVFVKVDALSMHVAWFAPGKDGVHSMQNVPTAAEASRLVKSISR